MRVRNMQEDKAEVSMSPLIDCVFLLLIFFLVATMSKKINKDIDINLPSSSSAIELKPDNDVLVIGIDNSGNFYYEGVPCTANEIHENLLNVSYDEPDKRIRIDTDADTPFYRFVEVLDICQFRNLNNVGIRTYDESYNK
jgi:biopolymer transport protein ExbD